MSNQQQQMINFTKKETKATIVFRHLQFAIKENALEKLEN